MEGMVVETWVYKVRFEVGMVGRLKEEVGGWVN